MKIKKRHITAGVLSIISALLITACSTLADIEYMEGTRKTVMKSDNYKNGKFINTIGEIEMLTSGTYMGLIKKMIFGREEREPERLLKPLIVDADSITGGKPGELKVTWLGHSSTIIEIEGKIILTDPVFSKRTSPLSFIGPKRYHSSPVIKPERLKKIDLVIISHDHYDHLDLETVKKIHITASHFVVPLGVGSYLKKCGVSTDKITEMNWWDEKVLPGGLKIAATPSQHFSGRSLFNRNRTLWASWVIEGSKRKIFFSGDSGYTSEFRKIGNKYGPFDMTLIENGQYNEQWQNVHMLPEESLQCHIDLKGRVMIPVHWAAYNLSVHDWFEPVERLLKAGAHNPKSVKISTPAIGEKVVYGKNIPSARWWDAFKSGHRNIAEKNSNLKPAENEG